MPSAFGQFMKERWEKLGLHQAEFCRRVGKPAGCVQQIREGKKTPPLGEMTTWANVLDLTGIDRQRFFDLAAVAHLPEEAQPRFLSLVDEAARRSGGSVDPKSEAKK